jgi:transketolase
MSVFQPCDEIETAQIIRFLGDHIGPAYVRLTRQALAPVHTSNYRWQCGKIDVLKQGRGNVAFLGTGAGVQECVGATEKLGAKGIDATVVNVSTIKPVDKAGIVELSRKHKYLFTVEDHYTVGGLGSAVAEVLAENGSQARLVRIGINERFGESGEAHELYDKFGLSAEKIVERVMAEL